MKALTTAADLHQFTNRREAGKRLAERLDRFASQQPVILGMPRGGVPVAFEIARALHAPLDVFVARKIGSPGHAELAMGAVAEGGMRVLNADVVRELCVSAQELEFATTRTCGQLEQRVTAYRGGREPLEVAGRTVILVDDGLATGATARAALRALRARGPRRLVLAVPVGPPETIHELEQEADEVVCLEAPASMWAIGMWYVDFRQVTDREVVELLERARQLEIQIELEHGGTLAGDLFVPSGARGLVVFAHGSGSSRHSPRNVQVARTLNGASFATLLFDLLTPAEERSRANVFAVELLAERLAAVTERVASEPLVFGLPIAYFGASTGAAAALLAAADLRERVAAVVSRGGRPDLAMPRLAEVTAPVLLIVGGADELVLELNRDALAELRCEARLEVVRGATHLFEEPGTLEAVAELATSWFAAHLRVRVDARA